MHEVGMLGRSSLVVEYNEFEVDLAPSPHNDLKWSKSGLINHLNRPSFRIVKGDTMGL